MVEIEGTPELRALRRRPPRSPKSCVVLFVAALIGIARLQRVHVYRVVHRFSIRHYH